MHNSITRWRSVLAVSLGVLLFGAGLGQLHAQAAGGALSGTVVDQVGKPISNAAVQVRNDASGLTVAVTADNEGKFSVPDLAPGGYTLLVSAQGFSVTTRPGAQVTAGTAQDISITLAVQSVTTEITVSETISLAASTAPLGNTLEATSARTEVTPEFIKNFLSPIADYAELVNYAPGTFSLNPNGIGLGQGKTFFRGFSDGEYTMTFDGIPFEDTNSPTHHSWANFPSGWTTGVDFDRSAGLASDIGPTNFGGSIHLLSPELLPDPSIRATASYGSWNTRLLQLDADSGFFGPDKKSSFLMDVQQLLSAGYQTDNFQKRVAGYGKYQYRFSDRTSLTAYGGLVDIWTNTPNTTNPTSGQVAQYGDNFLLQGNEYLSTGALNPYYFGFNYYHVQTDFEYLDFNSNLGNGWKFDTKAYTTRYWNKQNYQNGTAVNISANKPSGVDKLNGYRHAGDSVSLSDSTQWGVFRTGAWYDWAYTDRYQVPSNVLTWVDTPLGNFHEHFITQSFMPYAEWEWHPLRKLVITAGIKAAAYNMTLNQYQDNGKIVGCLGGTASTDPVTKAPICIGGGAFVTHSQNWNNWLPNLSARYFLRSNWSTYAQFSEGSVIPPSAVFDTVNGNPTTPAKPQLAKTYQVGSVLKFRRWTLDLDAYYVHFQNAYDSYTDPLTNELVFIASGPINTKGVEAESNVVIGWGFSLYANATFGSAKYQEGSFPNGGLWEANSPKNVETLALLWRHKNWDVGFLDKRVGTMYNDNGSLTETIGGVPLPVPVNQAITINPFTLLNFNVNYTVKNASWMRGSKIGLAVNNLADSHNIVGITPFTAATATAAYVPNTLDQLNLLPGRSVMVTLTAGWAPRR